MVTAIVEVPDQYLIVCDGWELVREMVAWVEKYHFASSGFGSYLVAVYC
jgi:hypothetical protein